ncbi:phosphonate ABC transporter, permease protein PhnE [Paraburkholderia sp. DHOC27]|uniref:phosphonate ABC transporter, permease protein PhnE n=1 Tax=Paraburkholderia sp. DHOC27 TaxID=2303330 RepID=UPI000E3B9D00|nr:phosphonate ABC transporter, permease protein PhnE [Paraburkholderia sp. DHOC27]RFU49270.1 phosphonate ABC transporter, permease protein PhnE [Paraburkholderia sp. DHOC27]
MGPPDSSARTATATPAVLATLAALEAKQKQFGWRRMGFCATLTAVTVFYAICFSLAHVDPARLLTGLPKIAGWLAQAWPPRVDELPLILQRTAETIAMATVGTTAAALLALPAALFASRNLTPLPALYLPTRWFLNMLRGIDSFVFALLFVAAVGLGPFAGVLGIAFHTWGSAAKLFADHLENTDLAAYDAVRTTGAGRFTSIAYAVLPDVLPVFASTALFWLEFNVRASTVLGVVGAGGIGQELKNSMDLLDFSRLFTIIAVILMVVTALDQISGWLRLKLA